MAKFTTSEGSFIWSAGNASSHINEDDYLLSNKIEELRDNTDYFAINCTNVYSNLESCFAEKSNDYGTRNETDRSTVLDTANSLLHGVDNTTNLGTEYDGNYSTQNATLYGALNATEYDTKYGRAYQVYYDGDKVAWCMRGHSNHDQPQYSYNDWSYNTAVRDNYNIDEYSPNSPTPTSGCTVVHSTAQSTVNLNEYTTDDSIDHSTFNGLFEDLGS